MTLLLHAAYKGDANMVMILLKAKANVLAKDNVSKRFFLLKIILKNI